jgi:hypothetical protein
MTPNNWKLKLNTWWAILKLVELWRSDSVSLDPSWSSSKPPISPSSYTVARPGCSFKDMKHNINLIPLQPHAIGSAKYRGLNGRPKQSSIQAQHLTCTVMRRQYTFLCHLLRMDRTEPAHIYGIVHPLTPTPHPNTHNHQRRPGW